MSRFDFPVAELIVMGFDGKKLSSGTQQALASEKAVNFILFAQNYESRDQLIDLTTELQARVREHGSTLPALISVDQEGGRVQRFKSGFTLLPSAREVGSKNSPSIAYELARVQARELFEVGIQLNFAPVCDINTNPSNPVIGDRAYGETSDRVSRIASAVVRGHLTEGVEPCIKHFPGHGDTHLDSHLALPTVHTPLEILKQREWVPFHRAMKSGCNFVMTAHILLPHLDAEFPATFSSTFLVKYLRGELLFHGAVISDDMEMGAVVNRYGAEEAPVLALQAGCDLLCYRSESHALVAMEAIRKAVTDGKLPPEKLKLSIERVRKIKARLRLKSGYSEVR